MRFGFGKNWKNYIQKLDNTKIEYATECLLKPLKLDSLAGKSFIDIGSGSGLMSLAAARKGARVLSFDYDKDSVEATQYTKDTFGKEYADWNIQQGSVLDKPYLESLGKFDIVYSWGVLHHTGDMWAALENVSHMVNPGGYLYIAIYNNQGFTSRLWKLIKRIYNMNIIGRLLISAIFIPYFYIIGVVFDLINHGNPVYSITHYQSNRGMSVWHDIIDWIGGYPFEVATHAQIFNFYHPKGFELIHVQSTTSVGCNEFVFKKK
jgi:SAM-dependent methyltransferase